MCPINNVYAWIVATPTMQHIQKLSESSPLMPQCPAAPLSITDSGPLVQACIFKRLKQVWSLICYGAFSLYT